MVKQVIRFLTESWGLKLVAVGLALLLWMGVRASEPERATFPGIRVEVDLRDPEWQLSGPPEPAAVDVTVLGPTSQLVTLGGDPPRIVLPVERVSDTAEDHVVPLQWVQLPRGATDVRVLGLRPDTIRLRYERLASATLPVKVRTTGSLPDSFYLARAPNANPAFVLVRGPARRLDALDSVPLVPVDIDGLRSTTNVPAQVDTAAMPGVSVIPDEVNVILRVTPDSLAPADTTGSRPQS